MCCGDGRAKRNRRVSWLMTYKEAQAVGTAPRAEGPTGPWVADRSRTGAHHMWTHDLHACV